MNFQNFLLEKDICNFYSYFLIDNLSINASKWLVKSFREANLLAYAEALQVYIEKHEGWTFIKSLTGNWKNARCFLGGYPPEEANILDIWFDLYQLTFMIKIPNYWGRVHWLALNPVTSWQYRVFLRLSKIKGQPAIPNDPIIDNKRFYATNLSGFEIEAYSFWHQKCEASHSDMKAASNIFSKKQMRHIFPKGYYFYDVGLSSCSGFVGYFARETRIQREQVYDDLGGKHDFDFTIEDPWERTPNNLFVSTLGDNLKEPRESPAKYEGRLFYNCARRL